MRENKLDKMSPVALNDDVLDSVAGGVEAVAVGRRQITTCDDFVCCWCKRRKASSSATSHVCEAQSGPGLHAGEYIEAVFENTCEWCQKRYSCDQAYTYVGLGSPTPP